MLRPYRVLDCTDGGAALGGQMLADLGADVILIEPLEGAASRRAGPFAGDVRDADRSLAFWATQRNKRSMALDLDSKAGRERFEALLAGADILIESWQPSWAREAGLGHEALRARHPQLIPVSITPFGGVGPKADWAATDLVASAASGQMLLCGDSDRAPLSSAVPQAFLHAGAEAAIGALLALAVRERDGVGQHVDVSAQTAMMIATQSMVLNAGWSDAAIERTGGGLRLSGMRLRFVYPCADGYVNFTFLFGPVLGPATARLFQWMYEGGFADESLRDEDWVMFADGLLKGTRPVSDVERAMEAIERFTKAHTKAELAAGAFARRVWLVPVSDVADLAASEQLEAREFWTGVKASSGETTRFPGAFARLSATPLRYERPPPVLDEHRAAIAGEVRAPRREPVGATPAAPLAGLKVLDFTWVYAGPAMTRVLTDFGATVVRVESQKKMDALRAGQPFKDGVPGFERSGGFANANAGKLGLGLDLSVPEGRQLAHKLVDWADVVVENFSPRAMKSWGLDYASLRKLKPDLVMLSTTLCGQTGPRAMQAGYGTMGAALAGFGYLTGWPDRPPSAPFLAYTDYVSPRFALAALLAALDHRRRTGEGQYIDVSQIECCVHFLGPAALDYQSNGRVWGGSGNVHPEYAPSGAYPCRGEDTWIAIAAPDDATFGALAAAASRDWADDPRFANAAARRKHREALDAAIAGWTSERSAGELEHALQEIGVPAHRLASSSDCLADPQLAALDHFVEVDHVECGPVPIENARVRLSRTPAVVTRPGPTLGEHNDIILRELLELSDDEITELAISGALE